MEQNQPTTAAPQLPKPVPDEVILKIAKEIAIKFIEVGRLNPSNFEEMFPVILRTVRTASRHDHRSDR